MSQKIEIKKTFGGYTYKQDGKPVSPLKMYSILNSSPEIAPDLKKVMPMYIISMLLTFVGFFILGYNIVFGLMTSGISWTEVGVGLAIGVLGYFLMSSPNKKYNDLVERYNSIVE